MFTLPIMFFYFVVLCCSIFDGIAETVLAVFYFNQKTTLKLHDYLTFEKLNFPRKRHNVVSGKRIDDIYVVSFLFPMAP